MILDIQSKIDYNINEFKKDFHDVVNITIKLLKLKSNLEISVIFISDQEITEINQKYRNINKPTNVISFAFEDTEENIEENIGIRVLGDIIIAPNYCINMAKKLNHSIRREIIFVFTHGLLHLLGFDHIENDDWDQMVKYEKTILKQLNIRC